MGGHQGVSSSGQGGGKREVGMGGGKEKREEREGVMRIENECGG